MKKKTLKVFKHLEDQRNEIINIYNTLKIEQLRFKPGPNKWNLLQVMSHLVTTEKQSLVYIQRKAARHDDAPETGFDSAFRYLLLKVALILPIKFKAPKIADVKEDYPNLEEMISEWTSVREAMQSLIENSNKTILSKALYRHPRAGMLNITQAFKFFGIHISHHQKQISRIINHPSFPANP